MKVKMFCHSDKHSQDMLTNQFDLFISPHARNALSAAR